MSVNDHRDKIEGIEIADLVQSLIGDVSDIEALSYVGGKAEILEIFRKHSEALEVNSIPNGDLQAVKSYLDSIFTLFEGGVLTDFESGDPYQFTRTIVQLPFVKAMLLLSADFESMGLVARMIQYVDFNDMSVPNDFPADIRQDFRTLIADSADMRKQADAWCIVFLAKGASLPQMFKEYLVAKTAGNLPELRRGSNKRARVIRNIIISILVNLLHEGFGLPRENHTGGISACGVVADCLGEIGVNMRESAVRKCAASVSVAEMLEVAQNIGSPKFIDAIRKDLKITFP